MTKFNFKTKLDILMPKITAKDFKNPKERRRAKAAFAKGAIKGAGYVEKSLKIALDNSIESNWAWRDGSTRNIVDTGRLKNSLQIKSQFAQTKVTFQIQYNTPYAAFVHYGGVMRPYGSPNAADVLIPARPWIQAIFDGTHGQPKFTFGETFQKGINEAWRAEFG